MLTLIMVALAVALLGLIEYQLEGMRRDLRALLGEMQKR